jgi:hypothetical protein
MATFIVAGRCDGTDTPMSDSMWVSFRETIADALAETLGEPDAEVTTHATWRFVADEETVLFVVMFPALAEYGRACRLLARVADAYDSPSVVVTDGYSDVILADDFVAPTITEEPTYYGAPVVLSDDAWAEYGDPWDVFPDDEDAYGPDALARAEAEASAWYGPDPWDVDDEAEALAPVALVADERAGILRRLADALTGR